jgi:hypothetical protein
LDATAELERLRLARRILGGWPKPNAPNQVAGKPQPGLFHQCADRLGPACQQTAALFPELEDERGKAEKVKQEVSILVILGDTV